MQDSFSRRQVERSFRKFNDTVSDLFQAKFQTWGNTFTHLITHCEQDSVMKLVTEPLRSNPAVDAEQWYSDALNSVHGMVDSGHYELPYDDDVRTALLYQFFLMLENNKVDFVKFCLAVYGTTRHQEAVQHFNQELVLKFTREVSYRLDEILTDLGDQKDVPREAMFVFHHHGHTMNFHGSIQGSNVAVGGSSITDSSATFTSNAELADALKALTSLIHEVVENQREAVETAIGLLDKAATDQTVATADVQKAAETVAANSTALKERLTSIAQKVGLSLLGSSISQGIKMALGLH
ncbi:MAG: hypothetical protein U0804_01665 [Gemmataceae bacterium]